MFCFFVYIILTFMYDLSGCVLPLNNEFLQQYVGTILQANTSHSIMSFNLIVARARIGKDR